MWPLGGSRVFGPKIWRSHPDDHGIVILRSLSNLACVRAGLCNYRIFAICAPLPIARADKSADPNLGKFLPYALVASYPGNILVAPQLSLPGLTSFNCQSAQIRPQLRREKISPAQLGPGKWVALNRKAKVADERPSGDPSFSVV